MKKLIGIAVVAALIAGPALAADHSGKYKAVEAKSSWSNGEFPKGFSLEIDVAFSPNKIVYHSFNDTDKKATGGLDFTTTLDGAPTPVTGQTRFDQVSVKQLGPNDFEILELKGKDVIVGAFWTFLPDGGFVRRGVGKSPEGVSKAYEEFFEKLK